MKRSPLFILAFTVFLDLLGFGLILPLLPIYIEHFGGKPAIGGLLLASFSTMQFLFSPIWGRMSDQRGRRPLILMSLIGSAISYFFFGFATTLPILFAARVASGILTAASLPTAQAYIADVTTPEKRSGGMALLGAAFGLGFAIGPVIGGVLSQHPILGISSLAMPAYFAAVLALLDFVLAFFFLPESHKVPENEPVMADQNANAVEAATEEATQHTTRRPGSERKGPLEAIYAIGAALQNPAVSAPLLVFAFASFAFTAVESSFSWLVLLRFHDVLTAKAAHTWAGFAHLPLEQIPEFVRKTLPANVDWASYARLPFTATPQATQRVLIEKASTATTSTIFGIVGVTILFVQGAVMGGLARRVGETRMVRVGALILTLTLLGIALAPQLWMIWVLSALVAVGNGIMNPSLNALVTQSAGPADRGSISGVQQSLGSLARIIAPPINTALVGWSTPVPFLASACLMLISFGLSLRLRPMSSTLSSQEPRVPATPPTVKVGE